MAEDAIAAYLAGEAEPPPSDAPLGIADGAVVATVEIRRGFGRHSCEPNGFESGTDDGIGAVVWRLSLPNGRLALNHKYSEGGQRYGGASIPRPSRIVSSRAISDSSS